MFVGKFTKIVKKNIFLDDQKSEYTTFFKQTLADNLSKMNDDQILVRYEKVVGCKVQQKNTIVDIDSINQFIRLNNTSAVHEIRTNNYMRFAMDVDDCPNTDYIINLQDVLLTVINKYNCGMPIIRVLKNSSVTKLAYHVYTNIWTSLQVCKTIANEIKLKMNCSSDCIDMGIYKRQGQMRLPNCGKIKGGVYDHTSIYQTEKIDDMFLMSSSYGCIILTSILLMMNTSPGMRPNAQTN